MLLKVVPRGDVAAAAVAQPVRVGRDTVVPPPLDVQRGQVQCNCVRHLEKEFTAKLVYCSFKEISIFRETLLKNGNKLNQLFTK